MSVSGTKRYLLDHWNDDWPSYRSVSTTTVNYNWGCGGGIKGGFMQGLLYGAGAWVGQMLFGGGFGGGYWGNVLNPANYLNSSLWTCAWGGGGTWNNSFNTNNTNTSSSSACEDIDIPKLNTHTKAVQALEKLELHNKSEVQSLYNKIKADKAKQDDIHKEENTTAYEDLLNRLIKLGAEDQTYIKNNDNASLDEGIEQLILPEDLSELTQEQAEQLKPDQINGISPDDIAKIPPEVLKGFTKEQLGALTKDLVDKLTDDQIAALDDEQKAILKNISPENAKLNPEVNSGNDINLGEDDEGINSSERDLSELDDATLQRYSEEFPDNALINTEITRRTAEKNKQAIEDSNSLDELVKVDYKTLDDDNQGEYMLKAQDLLEDLVNKGIVGDKLNTEIQKLPDALRPVIKFQLQNDDTDYSNITPKDKVTEVKAVIDTSGKTGDITTHVETGAGKPPKTIKMKTQATNTVVTYTLMEGCPLDGEYLYQSNKGGQIYALQKDGDGNFYLVQYVYHEGYGKADVQ